MLSKWQLRNPPNPTPKRLENIFRGAITSLLPVRNNAFLISISDASLFLKICNSWKIPNKNAKYDGRSNTGSFNLPSGSKLYVLRVLILESWQPGTEEPNHRTRVLKEGKRNGLRWDTGHCQGVNTEGGNSSDFYGLQVLNFSK